MLIFKLGLQITADVQASPPVETDYQDMDLANSDPHGGAAEDYDGAAPHEVHVPQRAKWFCLSTLNNHK